MNDKLTMTDQMWSHDGMTLGTETLFRFKASGMPGGDEAFFVNVHSGTPHEPLWRTAGRKNWQRFKQHCHESKTVLRFTDGTELAIDLSEYESTLSDLENEIRAQRT